MPAPTLPPQPTSIALATAPHLAELTPDDQRLLAELTARGVRAEPAVWDAPRDWSRVDAVVIRSCWDYYHRRADFLAWAHRVAAGGARVLNPVPLLAWNTDKRYLRELQALGVRVVPTRWISAHGAAHVPSLEGVLREVGWSEAVVKPAISAGAYETWRTNLEEADRDQLRFAVLARSGDVLVQPFVDEVVREGEWSLVFIAGHFSHAVRKRPAGGDFRVQAQYGGITEAAEPAEALVRDAAEVVRAAAQITGLAVDDILYARVDGVLVDGHLVLMELECVEPSLYFEQAPAAVSRFADALLEPREGEAAA